MAELQQDICHTDEVAWHKHTTGSEIDLLKHKEPKAEIHKTKSRILHVYTNTNRATCLQRVFVNFLNHNINGFEKMIR